MSNKGGYPSSSLDPSTSLGRCIGSKKQYPRNSASTRLLDDLLQDLAPNKVKSKNNGAAAISSEMKSDNVKNPSEIPRKKSLQSLSKNYHAFSKSFSSLAKLKPSRSSNCLEDENKRNAVTIPQEPADKEMTNNRRNIERPSNNRFGILKKVASLPRLAVEDFHSSYGALNFDPSGRADDDDDEHSLGDFVEDIMQKEGGEDPSSSSAEGAGLHLPLPATRQQGTDASIVATSSHSDPNMKYRSRRRREGSRGRTPRGPASSPARPLGTSNSPKRRTSSRPRSSSRHRRSGQTTRRSGSTSLRNALNSSSHDSASSFAALVDVLGGDNNNTKAQQPNQQEPAQGESRLKTCRIHPSGRSQRSLPNLQLFDDDQAEYSKNSFSASTQNASWNLHATEHSQTSTRRRALKSSGGRASILLRASEHGPSSASRLRNQRSLPDLQQFDESGLISRGGNGATTQNATWNLQSTDIGGQSSRSKRGTDLRSLNNRASILQALQQQAASNTVSGSSNYPLSSLIIRIGKDDAPPQLILPKNFASTNPTAAALAAAAMAEQEEDDNPVVIAAVSPRSKAEESTRKHALPKKHETTSFASTASTSTTSTLTRTSREDPPSSHIT